MARVAAGPCVVKIPPLAPRARHVFRLRFGMAGFGRLVVQPWVGVPMRGAAPGDPSLLRMRPYTVSPVALLQVRLPRVAARWLVRPALFQPTHLSAGWHHSVFTLAWAPCLLGTEALQALRTDPTRAAALERTS